MISQITSGSRRAQIHPLLTATCSAIYVYVTSTEGVHACLMDPARLWAVDHSIVERRSGDPVFHVIGCKDGVSISVDHGRSEESRGGKECVRTWRLRWWPYNEKKNTTHVLM